MTLMRVKNRWSGYQGGPGYNIFHFSKFGNETYTDAEATECATRVRNFFDAIKLYLPNTVKLDVMPDVEIIRESDGALLDVVNATVGATVSGTAGAGAQFAAAAGAVVTWRTQTVRNGRRMRGRTFIVPLANLGFATDGTLDTGFITAANTAATTLRSATGQAALMVYGRPSSPIAGDGTAAFAQSQTIPDMGAVLRSRRD